MTPPVQVADPAKAVCSFLATTVGGLLDEHKARPAVFRPRLPEELTDRMPLACLVVRPAGGYRMFGAGTMPVADPNMDITCYAAGPNQSYQIALAVAQSLKQLSQSVWENTTLYWAKIAGGPIPLPDAQTRWPATWVGIQVMAGEIAGQPA